jgi:CII-binding regulator of phage lambda lysogenization HflD
MKSHLYTCVTFICLLAFSQVGFAQLQEEGADKIDQALRFPDKLFGKLNEKAASLNRQLDKQTERYLTKLSKQEAKLRKKIAAKDSALAKRLFDGVEAKYHQLQTAPANVSKYASVYASGLDSLNTSLNFLKDNNIGNLASNPELQKTLNSYKELQSKFNASEQARRYIAERRQLLQEKLQQLGMMKELNQFKKQAALYQSQIQEYKNILNEPSKLESALLQLVQKVPAFKDFFARNSLLGSMFALPASGGAPATLPAGLQTRVMVNQNLISRFGSMDAVTQALQQNMPAAQNQLQQLKDKLNQYSSGSYGNSTSEMPDYKINNERSKSFWRRLYLSAGMQSQKAYSVLPVTSDISAALNFKWSEKKVIGVGVSGKIGWGSGWRHIKITQQGMGIKSFLDIKLKGSFWISGGYELNYRPGLSVLDSAVNAAHNQHVNLWQRSGLIGVSKIVSLRSKVAKKTKVQILWDYLSYSQQPKTPAFIWRVEYAFK